MESKKHKIARKAPDALKILWEEGFFKVWQNGNQVEESLAKKGYHFTNATLGMALKQATHLTRRGRRGSYEYIQKYPFIAEEEHGKRKKAK